jgi:hypothetical protein
MPQKSHWITSKSHQIDSNRMPSRFHAASPSSFYGSQIGTARMLRCCRHMFHRTLQLLSSDAPPALASLLFEIIPDENDMFKTHTWLSTLSRVALEKGIDISKDMAGVLRLALAHPVVLGGPNRYQVHSLL